VCSSDLGAFREGVESDREGVGGLNLITN